MTFTQQIILMLADKLFVGVVVAVVVYLAQKRLEKFRSEQSLQNEIAKKRVHRLASGWKALNDWDFAVTQLIAKFAGLLRNRLNLADEAGVDELGLPDVGAIADWLALQLQTNRPLIAEIKQDCDDVLQPLVRESIRCSNQAKAAMQENRFWFGKELYDHCKQFHAALHQVCVSFSTKEFERLPLQLRALNDRRDDILTALQKVRSLTEDDVQPEKS
jgi:hypothetical protein